jgi:hypothetical protein
LVRFLYLVNSSSSTKVGSGSVWDSPLFVSGIVQTAKSKSICSHLISSTEEVPKAKPKRKGEEKAAKAKENPLSAVDDPAGRDGKGDPPAIDEPQPGNAPPAQDDQIEAEIQQDDFWSRLNRNFSPGTDEVS